MQSQNFFGLDGLTDLGKRTGIDMRPTLLRVLTDLYVHRLGHTAQEERHYTELVLPMLEAVDIATRAAVAKRLARYPSPPLAVLQWLARDLLPVAAELHAHLEVPPAPMPRATSALNGGGHGSGRTQQPAAPDALDTANDAPVEASLNPASNPVSNPVLDSALDSATAGELNELFFLANAEERRLILLNLDVVAPTAPDERRAGADRAIGQELEAAVLAGRTEHFAVRLAQVLRIPPDQARRIARDQLGEPVVVAGKALGMAREALYRVLMFINPAVGHSVERVHSLAALHDEMTAAAAEAMVAIWRALPGNERIRAKHQKLAWDDETRRRVRQGLAVPRKPLALPKSDRRSTS
jgi:hypothetical protein